MADRVSPTLLRVLQSVGRDLFVQGLNSSHSGNLSIRDGDIVWITRRGAPLGRLRREDIVGVPMQNPEAAASEASSELPSHLATYSNDMAGAVLHAHPPAAIALSLSRHIIEPVDLEGRYHMPRVDVVVPQGPYDPHCLAIPVGEALQRARVAVIRGHGTFSRGADLWEALHWTSSLEHSCRILVLSLLDRA